ncbi:MAG: glycosyltransferase family 4 protein [Candidatus Omnitrophica bacterium]|nr:glycosyltransferase family 4 protein [Candidatus Omnitrophota bacterium]
MKVAVLGTRGFPDVQGGIESHCENLYPCLSGKGCEVTVYTRKPYVDVTRDNYQGVKLVPLSCLKNKFLESFLHTFLGIFIAKKNSPDILHIHGIGPSLAVPVARLLGLKVVVTNHGPDYKRKKWGKLAKLILVLGEYLGSRFANGIICISESIGDGIREKYGRHAVIVPNGVPMARFSEGSDIIKKYGLTKGKYILTVGRIVPEKGFHDLIEAFNNIDDRKLVIVGRADHPDRYSIGLREKAEKNKNIVLTGLLTGEPLRQLYSHAGLFVLPSYYEGLSMVLLEAMSYGLSCITSDISANKNVGLDDDRLFKTGDVQAMAAKIKQFIEDPIQYEDKKAQVSMIAKEYNWGKIANMTLDVYNKVINT